MCATELLVLELNIQGHHLCFECCFEQDYLLLFHTYKTDAHCTDSVFKAKQHQQPQAPSPIQSAIQAVKYPGTQLSALPSPTKSEKLPY